ncbi:MAG: mandelate racemase/muconate lactonizing enzyme family protein [Chloroflexi bacterium]|nr:mandelate racemase/muconate lactonizing enzyme family protein [Chloroflexota bacterium]
MRIRGVHSRVVSVPIRRPVVARIGSFDRMWFVLVDVDTDEGVSGLSYLWVFSRHGARAVQGVLDELAEVALGEDPFFSARLWHRMWSRITQWGHKGLAVIGMAGIDVAVWDVVGKTLGKPLAHVLGAHSDPVLTYASEGLWLTEDFTTLAREAVEILDGGHNAIKMRLGRERMQDDVEAVRVVRDAIGSDVRLMVDSNQGWDVGYAIRIGRKLEEFDLTWMEEPVPHDDLVGHARIAAALDTPIASGENWYSPAGFRDALEQRACDILMPDLERVGGVTGWMRAAALAETWNVRVCSHLFPEISVHLMSAAATGYYLEHVPWGEVLFEEPLPVVNGTVSVPGRPGLGLTWNEDVVKRFSVD